MPILNESFDLMEIPVTITTGDLQIIMAVLTQDIESYGNDPAFRIFKHALMGLREQLGYTTPVNEYAPSDSLLLCARIDQGCRALEDLSFVVEVGEWQLLTKEDLLGLKYWVLGDMTDDLYSFAGVGVEVKIVDTRETDFEFFSSVYPELYAMLEVHFGQLCND